MRRKCGVDEQRDAPLLAQGFVEANNCAFAQNRHVPGLLAQLLEEAIEVRILEFLCRDIAGITEPAGRQSQPLEVAIVKRSDDAAVGGSDVGDGALDILELDVFPEVFLGQPWTPEEVEHGPGEM